MRALLLVAITHSALTMNVEGMLFVLWIAVLGSIAAQAVNILGEANVH
jgi:hypothetical protein